MESSSLTFLLELGIISTLNIVSNYTFLYSTVPILDSGGNVAPWTALSPAPDNSAFEIQLVRCSQSLVQQKAVVDAQSQQLMTVMPSMEKTSSTWSPSPPPSSEDYLESPANMLATPGISLIDTVWS